VPPVTMTDAPAPPAQPPVRVQVTDEDRGLVWTAEGATRARDSSFRSPTKIDQVSHRRPHP